MGLADRFAGGGSVEPTITCRRYEARPGTKRCRHYLDGGSCGLPDEFMCIEWLKANGHTAPAPLPPLDKAPASLPSPAPGFRLEPPLSSTPPPERRPTNDEAPVVRKLTTEDLAAFEALGREVCLVTEDCGELWIVPAYTGRDDRTELSVRDAATLAALCIAFPGARVTRLAPFPSR